MFSTRVTGLYWVFNPMEKGRAPMVLEEKVPNQKASISFSSIPESALHSLMASIIKSSRLQSQRSPNLVHPMPITAT